MALNYYNNIVQLNVSETIAPVPNRLQQRLAVVNLGGTNTPLDTPTYISGPGQLVLGFACSATAYSSPNVTLTTSAAHNIPVGGTFALSGFTPSGYNGTWTAITGTTGSTVVFAPGTSLGTVTVEGRLTEPSDTLLNAFDVTWWANSTKIGYYIFECGEVTTAAALTAVSAYIAANPQFIYAWHFLPGMDVEATLPAFLNQHTALDGLVTFYLPVTASSYSTFATSTLLKEVMATVQSPGAAVQELDSAAYANYLTGFIPSPTNKLPPSQWTFSSNTTPYSPLTNALITTYTNGNINFITTGMEGGIPNAMLVRGVMLDGTPANVKYAIDWVQIQLNESIANAVINGSNQPINPLDYNQAGITTLQGVAAQVANLAIASGLALGAVVQTQLTANEFNANANAGAYAGQFVINAVPFADYVLLEPSNYSQGIYGGFQIVFTPQYGFTQIVINLNATQFA